MKYIDKYESLLKENEKNKKTRFEIINKFIEEIANDLGYKDKLTWDEIQSVYIPNGLSNTIMKQQEFQNIQLQVGQIISNKLNEQQEKDSSNKK